MFINKQISKSNLINCNLIGSKLPFSKIKILQSNFINYLKIIWKKTVLEMEDDDQGNKKGKQQ